MKYQALGNSNIEVSEVAFGCMSLRADSPENENIIHRALEYGVNFFDTADLYEFGRNEELLAKALHGKRKEVIIATKVGNAWTAAKDGWSWNPSKDYLLKAVEDSLRRLKTDYIDLYQLHGGTIEDPIDETIEAFELLKEQGKIRAYGISSIRPNVIREYIKRSNIVSVMMQYSLLDRRPEETMLDLLSENNISVIVRGALAKGLLVDKPADAYLGMKKDDVARAQAALADLAATKKIAKAQLATRYILHDKAVATAAIGFRTLNQVNNLMTGFDKSFISAENHQLLAETEGAKQYTAHR
jgi:aryl-alcohol dehydrogenase-like predicted oxidoreductase